MKRSFLFVMVVSVIMFLGGCNPGSQGRRSETTIDTIDVDENVFEALKSCEELDEECVYILKAKQAIDNTRLKLVKFEDDLQDISKLSDKEEFTKCIYRILGITTSSDESLNIFKTHILYLSDFLSEKQEKSGSQFVKFKYDLLSKNASIIETGKPVLAAQENYNEANERFQKVLQQILGFVEKNDLKGAAALLNSEDAIAQRVASVELMNALYKFECARAKSVMDICDTYKDIY